MQPFEIPEYTPPAIFNHINFSLVFNTPVLIIIFILFGLFYVLVSVVLVYHWSRYGMKSPGIRIAEVLFLFVSLFLFGCGSLALLNF